jgi:uncharacterized protein (TIGR02246 family)
VSKPVRLDFCLEAHVKMLLAVVLVLFTLGPPAHAQGTAAPAIDRIIAEFVDTFNARDLTKLASLYADDAVWMPPNSPMIKGHGAIEAAFKERFKGPGVLKFTSTTSAMSGTLAFVEATYTLTVPVEGAAPVSFTAKSLTVFKRVGNDWKIAYDMQNGDQPPPPR